MNQKPMQCFESKCAKAKIFVENDMPIGVFHDFLMELRGMMVERMIAAHKEQQAEMQKQELPVQDDCVNQEQCNGI